MPFVQRDDAGKVVGQFGIAQPGFAEEWLEPESPDLAPQPPTREAVNEARLRAYANPLTGSDRYIAEAYAERAKGDEAAANEVDAKMIARREEIKAANPWPEEAK